MIVEAFKLAKALKVQLTADPMLEAQFDARMEDEIEAVKHEFDDPNATRPLEPEHHDQGGPDSAPS